MALNTKTITLTQIQSFINLILNISVSFLLFSSNEAFILKPIDTLSFAKLTENFIIYHDDYSAILVTYLCLKIPVYINYKFLSNINHYNMNNYPLSHQNVSLDKNEASTSRLGFYK